MARPGPADKLKIEERRRRVASLYLMHMTQEEIGRQLGIRQQVVSEDIAAVRAGYRRERTEILDREAAELDQMERDCAVEFARTKDREWVAERRAIKERRARMIGLDAPTRKAIELTTKSRDELINFVVGPGSEVVGEPESGATASAGDPEAAGGA